VEVKKTLNALKEVLPEFDNDPSMEKYNPESDKELEIYPAKKQDRLVGTAIKTFSQGFSGTISLMIGFDKDNKIYKISVMSHTETPGLGSKMADDKFKRQFESKDPISFKLKVEKDGGDVDAITAATVSSRAFCLAVDRAYKALQALSKAQPQVDSATSPATSPGNSQEKIIAQPDNSGGKK
ncbi:MAG: RnfABCDGE type electron transport complex subunit G, partial [Candidatus Aminicenantes bacterium]|nr:RnfABCDGE type electron transport complex subunit G [Candidatus Aminicenantes bacterium]